MAGLKEKRYAKEDKWMEVVRMVLKKCNLSEDLPQDGLEWRNKIHVTEHSWGKALMIMTTKLYTQVYW